ncbi:cupin domain-containing protein [Terrimonas sp. NA20]|uniref:Cupin domain-containing protein n=1 Tax=Terrimonas ginsenosidimutans TaxID=2908004 RepID=A0ABS9KSI1_9BACT|nr:cupin domain-containing protein [Terrimonas ginsenosidimutans]MCG2615282.1 cupin domain-containing protein [Terrimonas ginsenosidimutans]
MANQAVETWIKHLQLNRHVEGGWYSEVYRSALTIPGQALSPVFPGDRSACTHIYFLLEKENFSAFHRIRSDEIWHFYHGDAIIVYEIDGAGSLTEHLLGNDPSKGHSLCCVIKAGNWFASRVADGGEYGLAGCTVAPGFDFNDFELAFKEQLSKEYPEQKELINSMCRQ